MIQGQEAINPDQETTSINQDRIRLFYPRGSTTTVLAYLSDQDPPIWATANITEDNGFTQCIRNRDGNYEFPGDRKNVPGGVVLGLKAV